MLNVGVKILILIKTSLYAGLPRPHDVVSCRMKCNPFWKDYLSGTVWDLWKKKSILSFLHPSLYISCFGEILKYLDLFCVAKLDHCDNVATHTFFYHVILGQFEGDISCLLKLWVICNKVKPLQILFLGGQIFELWGKRLFITKVIFQNDNKHSTKGFFISRPLKRNVTGH